MTSSDALLAIINNILDLATIDAGVMTLELGEVDIRDAMQGAAEAVQPRLAESGVTLEMKAAQADRHLRGGRQARAPGAVQPALQRHRLLAAWRPRLAVGRAQGRRDRLPRRGPRQGHPAGGDRPRLRPLRIACRRHRPSRRRPRPVDRALLRRAAWRHGRAGVRGRPRHHRHLPLPGRWPTMRREAAE